MAQTQYLKRLPSGVYVVRMYVPRQLQPVLGKKELHASTRCRDLPIAKVVASGLVADWHRRLAGLLSMDPSKVLSGSLDLQHDGLISLDQAAAQLGSDRQRLAEHLLQRRTPFFVHLVDQPGYLIQDFDLLHHERDETGLVAVDLSDGELERHGVPRRLSSDVALRFPDEVRSLVQAGTLNACMFLLPPIKQMGFIVPLPGVPLAAEQLQVRTRDVEALRLSLLLLALRKRPWLEQDAVGAPNSPMSCSPVRLDRLYRLLSSLPCPPYDPARRGCRHGMAERAHPAPAQEARGPGGGWTGRNLSMTAMLSASVLAALLTLAGHAGAQAVLKPPVNAKPGTGQTANVIMTEGGPAPCPKGPDGADACTVVVTGERSGGGGGGDAPCAMSGCSGSLPTYDPGKDGGGGTN